MKNHGGMWFYVNELLSYNNNKDRRSNQAPCEIVADDVCHWGEAYYSEVSRELRVTPRDLCGAKQTTHGSQGVRERGGTSEGPVCM